MRKIVIMMLAGMALVAAGCSSNTYSNLRNQEDKLIANYISRNKLTILKEEPAADHIWAENEYYKVTGYDNLYYHPISRGDTTYEVVTNDMIVMRYKKFELTENADTASYWTTLEQAYPMEFHYGNLTECEAVAWHVAIKLMKYTDSQCEIIVPSKLGFVDDQTTVTPYVYILKIKVRQ